MERQIAAYTLADEIGEIQTKLECAENTLHHIQESYFEELNNKTNHRQIPFIWEDLHKFGVFAIIVSDYLFQIRKIVNELSNLGDEQIRNNINKTREKGANK